MSVDIYSFGVEIFKDSCCRQLLQKRYRLAVDILLLKNYWPDVDMYSFAVEMSNAVAVEYTNRRLPNV